MSQVIGSECQLKALLRCAAFAGQTGVVDQQVQVESCV